MPVSDILKKIFPYGYYKMRRINEQIYFKTIRKKLKNKDFTIISNNCVGGLIYHSLGCRFNSPTINLSIEDGAEFLEFVKNVKYYSDCELIEEKNNTFKYPVGILKAKDKKHKDITIHFMHYDDFESAKEKWIDRYKRVNYNNIYYIWEFYDNRNDINLLKEFDKLSINKIALLHKKIDGIKDFYVFDCYKKEDDVAKIMDYKGITGKRNLDDFNYVEFINSNMSK